MIPQATEGRIPETRYPERRGVSPRSVIEKAKAQVETIALADLLCGPGQMRNVGDKWVARCPLPDHHEDRSPSFTVYPNEGGWFCYGCLRGGDVVELARFAWAYDKGEVAMAAAQLLTEFGYPIPERAPAFFRRQERQATVRQALEDAKIGRLQRRIYRWLLVPAVELIGGSDEEKRETVEVFWGLAGELSAEVWARRAS
jgi:hypothetical protein